MKRALPILVILAVAWGASAFAAGYNTQYTCQDTTIASSTVPVNVLPAAFMSTFCISNPSGNGTVLVFPYTGSIPGAVPSGVIDIPAGGKFCDQVTCDNNTCRDAIGEAWGVALATGSTSTVVHACYR